MKDFAEMNEEYKKWFTHKPARACVAVHQLPLGCTVGSILLLLDEQADKKSRLRLKLLLWHKDLYSIELQESNIEFHHNLLLPSSPS